MNGEAVAVDILRKEIAKRLKTVCPNVPREEFDGAVNRLARLEHSYELLDRLEEHTRENGEVM
jgi:hypothetical protein